MPGTVLGPGIQEWTRQIIPVFLIFHQERQDRKGLMSDWSFHCRRHHMEKHRLRVNVSCWSSRYSSSQDGAFIAEGYDAAVIERKARERRVSTVILEKKTSWLITWFPGGENSVHVRTGPFAAKYPLWNFWKLLKPEVCKKEALAVHWPMTFPVSAFRMSER